MFYFLFSYISVYSFLVVFFFLFHGPFSFLLERGESIHKSTIAEGSHGVRRENILIALNELFVEH